MSVASVGPATASDSDSAMSKSPKRGKAAAGDSAPAAGGEIVFESPFINVDEMNAYWNWDNVPSPYVTASHRAFRKKVRDFVQNEMSPYVEEWEAAKEYPVDLNKRAADAGVYGLIWPREHGGTRPDDFDQFHEQIFWEEVSGCGSSGTTVGCFFITAISLPPILDHGLVAGPEKTKRVLREVITGEAVSCLAISEPTAGSDVANIRTTGKKITENGKEYYVLNGEKTYISGGIRGKYFTTAVRTGGKGLGGISLILVEDGTPGFTKRRLSTQGWETSFTTALTFDDCKVPAENLIGEENVGFYYIMENFNNERYRGICMGARGNRDILEDCVAYAKSRKTFGKPLIKHQVIAHKLAEMIRLVMACNGLVEKITLMMKQDKDDERLAGMIAICKVQVSMAAEQICREAMQIFGGRAYLRGGRGGRVERAYREVRVSAIGGGSEEIMRDLGVKMARL